MNGRMPTLLAMAVAVTVWNPEGIRRGSLNPRHHPQCVQRPTPSDHPPNPARISRSGYVNVAPSDRRSMNRYGRDRLVCKFPINVTVPWRVRSALQIEPAQL